MKTVKVRDLILGDGNPKVCIPLTGRNTEEIEEQLEKIFQAPFDLLEWRADYFEDIQKPGCMEKILELLRERLGEKPLLFTFRTKAEGGEQDISEEGYVTVCVLAAVSRMADLIDVEINRGEILLKALADQIHALGCKVIASCHDFKQTPSKEDLIAVILRMQELGADITKYAVMPQKEQDVLDLLQASLDLKLQYADRPFITMSMSRLGSVSRLAGSLTGSALTFAAAGKTSAPGQLEAQTLSAILRQL